MVVSADQKPCDDQAVPQYREVLFVPLADLSARKDDTRQQSIDVRAIERSKIRSRIASDIKEGMAGSASIGKELSSSVGISGSRLNRPSQSFKASQSSA